MDDLSQMIGHFLQWPLWGWIWSLGNSNFAAALLGALAGAMTAQRIAERSKLRDELLREIRSTESAITLSFTVLNSALALKRQFVRDLYETYNSKKNELETHLKQCTASGGAPGRPFEFQADLRSIQMPLVPIELLRSLGNL